MIGREQKHPVILNDVGADDDSDDNDGSKERDLVREVGTGDGAMSFLKISLEL